MSKKVVKAFVAITAMVSVLSTGIVAFAAEDYVVQNGDYLKRIAKQSYGDETKWEIVYEANKDIIKNPNLIYAGQVLAIPDLAEDENVSDAAETTVGEAGAVPSAEETAPIAESNATQNAAFEQYEVVCNAQLDTTYPYVIPCYDKEYATNGKVTFSDYQVFESDETHEALDGYEWRAVTCTVNFDDENAYNHGYSGIGVVATDYYSEAFFDNYKENNVSFSATYNGKEYSGIQYDQKILFSDWHDYGYTYKFRDFYRVPKGHDGVILAIYNPTIDWSMAKTSSDTIIFRLK